MENSRTRGNQHSAESPYIFDNAGKKRPPGSRPFPLPLTPERSVT
jgi:hypothetical protein